MHQISFCKALMFSSYSNIFRLSTSWFFIQTSQFLHLLDLGGKLMMFLGCWLSSFLYFSSYFSSLLIQACLLNTSALISYNYWIQISLYRHISSLFCYISFTSSISPISLFYLFTISLSQCSMQTFSFSISSWKLVVIIYSLCCSWKMWCFSDLFQVYSSTIYSCNVRSSYGELFILIFILIKNKSIISQYSGRKHRLFLVFLILSFRHINTNNRMGTCWPASEKSGRSPSLSPPQIKPKQVALSSFIIDKRNSLFKSYRHKEQRVYEKMVYDWKSIPIVTELDLTYRTSFQIMSKGIKDNNFVVGVIKKSAINMQISLPWKTQYCICYQSHEGKGQSGIIYNGALLKTGQGVKPNEIIKVLVSEHQIQFKNDGKTMGKLKIPVGFLNDEIYPYVALFNVGDQIQFINQVSVKQNTINQ